MRTAEDKSSPITHVVVGWSANATDKSSSKTPATIRGDRVC